MGDRYVIEKYRSDSEGQIHPVEPERPRATGRRRRIVAGVAAVKKLRPERDEIIVCTALNLKASGIQYWGSAAARFSGHAPCALTGVAGHAAQGPGEAGAGSPPPPAPRRAHRQWDMHPLRPASSRARSQSLHRFVPRSAAPPTAPAVRRPARRASSTAAAIRSAAAEPTAPGDRRRRRARQEAGLCTSCGRRRPEDNRSVCEPCSEARRALDRRRYAARHGCRLLRTLQAAHGRRPVALRPMPRAGEGARLSRARERCREEALRREARAGRMRGLWSPHRGRGALSALRISFQLPRARASPGGALAAADHRGRIGDGRRVGRLRDRIRGRRLHRLRPPAP